MNDHAKALWGHLPSSVQHIARSAFAGAGIGMLTAMFAETMKQVGVQPPPIPPGQTGQTGKTWTGNEQYRRHHYSHHRKARS